MAEMDEIGQVSQYEETSMMEELKYLLVKTQQLHNKIQTKMMARNSCLVSFPFLSIDVGYIQ